MTEEDLKDWQTDIFPNGFIVGNDTYHTVIESNDADGYLIEIYNHSYLILMMY